jgi:hypothetical protein
VLTKKGKFIDLPDRIGYFTTKKRRSNEELSYYGEGAVIVPVTSFYGLEKEEKGKK